MNRMNDWLAIVRSTRAVALVVAGACVFAPPVLGQITYEMVTVGDAGNAADTTGYGAVSGTYQIGKYEVTIAQYTAFLNSIAKVPVIGLWDPQMMGNATIAGIDRAQPIDINYVYTVIGPSGTTPSGADSPGNRPISYVSWHDAARFANWMCNGQPTGAPGPTTTENGAYALDIASNTAVPVNAINPNTGAPPLYCLPNENQWYKAAFYKGGGTSAGYWAYATQSDSAPGNTIGSGPNQANWQDGVLSVTQALLQPGQNYLTNVGAFSASPSAYGAFDMNGNVMEWYDIPTFPPSPFAGRRGGYWSSAYASQNLSSSAIRDVHAAGDRTLECGFRLATPVAVPEPSTAAAMFAGLACCGYSMVRRRRRA